MKFLKIIISFSVFAFSFLCCNAQQDSTVQLSGTDTSLSANDYSIPPLAADTTLVPGGLTLSADSINVLKESNAFAYAKNLDSLLKVWQKDNEVKVDISENKPGLMDLFFNSGITKTVLWILAISFILFILYKLFFTQGFFQNKSVRNNVNVLTDDDTTTDNPDYDKLIEKAVNSRDYRQAVRYLYLRSLQKLADNKLVQPAADKTNYQYINELNNTVYKDGFLWLTLSYEYVWYGEFKPDDKAFADLYAGFDQFNNRLQKS